ncbi:guanine nucleotide-binding protein G(t) subunit alpha-3 [Chytriomyces sp. MP71]|nr:guanine nucleotide-binding protein G(t) subunit alpha-3 [Chytriomyces sp. MP71]
MGNHCTAFSSESRVQKQASRAIDALLLCEQRAFADEIKILLLGASESGKSTLLKQMKIVYGTGFTLRERDVARVAILQAVLEAGRDLVLYMARLLIPFGFDPARDGDARVDEIADRAAKLYKEIGDGRDRAPRVARAVEVVRLFREEDCIGGPALSKEVVEALQILWADSGVRYCFERASEFQMVESCAYFLDQVERVGAAEYVPTDQDVLMARTATMAVSETRFMIDGKRLRVFDVGGQRGERKKWAPYFENVTAIIFIVAISAYDQTCSEDETANRLLESMNLFASICNHTMFRHTDFLLFLNKIDLFQEKIGRVSFKNFYPLYSGPDEYEPAIKFLSTHFLSLNKRKDKSIMVHRTWATDTKTSKKILDAVRLSLIKGAFGEFGLM